MLSSIRIGLTDCVLSNCPISSQSVAWWCSGYWLERRTCDQEVATLTPGRALQGQYLDG